MPVFYTPLILKKIRVVETLRLADGALFPMPITLDVDKFDIERLGLVPGKRIALRDPRDDEALAILTGELGEVPWPWIDSHPSLFSRGCLPV